jgi:salicylate hydroxylase
MDDAMAEDDLQGHISDKLPGFLGWVDPELDVFWVTYTCRSGKILNNAVVHNTSVDAGTEQDAWHSPASTEQVLAMLKNFHPAARKIVTMANEDGIKVHQLFKRPPLASFARGRAVVVGDAAHVMMPTHAAGGAMAIESAATLEVLFTGVNGADGKEMEERLRLFDQLRVPRCNLAMLASNAGHDVRNPPNYCWSLIMIANKTTLVAPSTRSRRGDSEVLSRSSTTRRFSPMVN